MRPGLITEDDDPYCSRAEGRERGRSGSGGLSRIMHKGDQYPQVFLLLVLALFMLMNIVMTMIMLEERSVCLQIKDSRTRRAIHAKACAQSSADDDCLPFLSFTGARTR